MHTYDTTHKLFIYVYAKVIATFDKSIALNFVIYYCKL